jgi:hypothetical protein
MGESVKPSSCPFLHFTRSEYGEVLADWIGSRYQPCQASLHAVRNVTLPFPHRLIFTRGQFNPGFLIVRLDTRLGVWLWVWYWLRARTPNPFTYWRAHIIHWLVFNFWATHPEGEYLRFRRLDLTTRSRHLLVITSISVLVLLLGLLLYAR